MTDELRFEVADQIATITLNRPEKLNAFTTEMLSAWVDALEEAAEREDVRVIVLTGVGRGFCSGGDVGKMKSNLEETPYTRKRSLAHRVHRIPLLLQSIDKPLIVAVNGVATGAGMDMALMGDIRICARSARFAETYIRVGLFAGDGGTWFLPRIVGTAKALELFWTGRFVESDEAERLGIVNSVVEDADLMQATYEMAARIAAQPPVAIGMMKRAVYQSRDMDLRTHLDMASSHMAVVRSTDDYREAINAFHEKRPGQYVGR